VTPLRADVPAPGPVESQQVLLPSAATRIEAAFARAQPVWRMESAAIERDRVVATVCDQRAVCYPLTLRARNTCAVPSGPWCVQWQGPPPAAAASLEQALSLDAPATLWSTIAARVPQPPEVAAPAPQASPGPSAPRQGQAAQARAATAPDRAAADDEGARFWWRTAVLAGITAVAAALAVWRLGVLTAGTAARPREPEAP
jgi:hypothetical protein